VNHHKTMGEEVRRLRRKSGFLQSQLAEFLDLEQSAVCRIENGKRSLTIPEAIVLKHKIDLDIYRVGVK